MDYKSKAKELREHRFAIWEELGRPDTFVPPTRGAFMDMAILFSMTGPWSEQNRLRWENELWVENPWLS